VSDLPVTLAPPLSTRLASAFDRQGKIVRALEALGPVADRDVILLDSAGGAIERGLAELGARLSGEGLSSPLRLSCPDTSADAVIALWTAFRGFDPDEVAEADRVLRVGGRLLIVHDYGRDDVSHVLGVPAEPALWSRPDGPFLSNGFRVRVLHCWWEFDSLEEAAGFLGEAFGADGSAVAATLKRPRLSHKIAIYHRSRPAN
jgi:hypothetical protein